MVVVSHQVTLGWALGCLLEPCLGQLYFLVKYRVVVSMYRLNNPVPLKPFLEAAVNFSYSGIKGTGHIIIQTLF